MLALAHCDRINKLPTPPPVARDVVGAGGAFPRRPLFYCRCRRPVNAFPFGGHMDPSWEPKNAFSVEPAANRKLGALK